MASRSGHGPHDTRDRVSTKEPASRNDQNRQHRERVTAKRPDSLLRNSFRRRDWYVGDIIVVPHLVPTLDPKLQKPSKMSLGNVTAKQRYAIIVSKHEEGMLALPITSRQEKGIWEHATRGTALYVLNEKETATYEHKSHLALYTTTRSWTPKAGSHVNLCQLYHVSYKWKLEDPVAQLGPISRKLLRLVLQEYMSHGARPHRATRESWLGATRRILDIVQADNVSDMTGEGPDRQTFNDRPGLSSTRPSKVLSALTMKPGAAMTVGVGTTTSMGLNRSKRKFGSIAEAEDLLPYKKPNVGLDRQPQLGDPTPAYSVRGAVEAVRISPGR